MKTARSALLASGIASIGGGALLAGSATVPTRKVAERSREVHALYRAYIVDMGPSTPMGYRPWMLERPASEGVWLAAQRDLDLLRSTTRGIVKGAALGAVITGAFLIAASVLIED